MTSLRCPLGPGLTWDLPRAACGWETQDWTVAWLLPLLRRRAVVVSGRGSAALERTNHGSEAGDSCFCSVGEKLDRQVFLAFGKEGASIRVMLRHLSEIFFFFQETVCVEEGSEAV